MTAATTKDAQRANEKFFDNDYPGCEPGEVFIGLKTQQEYEQMLWTSKRQGEALDLDVSPIYARAKELRPCGYACDLSYDAGSRQVLGESA